MLIAAAVCPHPPILVPEMAGAAAPELDGLRAACYEAVRGLAGTAFMPRGHDGRLTGPGDPAAGPQLLIVIGADDATRTYADEAFGDLTPYGLPLTVGRGAGERLPLSLTIGMWLLLSGQGVVTCQTRFQGVAEGASTEECLALGRELAGSAERVAMLVMGDGSACRDVKAPGYWDARAGAYDTEVARALGQADAAALAALDPLLSRELQVAGRAAWQVLAGAAGEDPFNGVLLAEEAPYGVGYFVAGWSA